MLNGGDEIPHSRTPSSCSSPSRTVLTVGAAAQEPKSAAPAKELAQLLASKKLESIAARMPDSREEFVGALTFPGQLMVVWAKTTAPSVVNEKLMRKEYKEVYIDLNSASVVESRHFVTDLGPDGLRASPNRNRAPPTRTTPARRACASTAAGARTRCRRPTT